MDILNIIIGVLLIILGVYLIKVTSELTRTNKSGGFTFDLGTAGIGSIILGVAMIIREFNFF